MKSKCRNNIGNKHVIVNATALASSGALTILKQFLKNAATDHQRKYLCFVPERLDLPTNENIQLVPVKKQKFISRLYWDWFGVNHYIKKNNLRPIKIVSLQNTSVITPYPQIIYLHQSIPFGDFKPRINIKNFNLLIYKYLYSFFIFLKTKNTLFVVQTDWMKKAILKKKPMINPQNIYVIKPDVDIPAPCSTTLIDIDDDIIRALYPATDITYKNHTIILEAIALLKKCSQLKRLKFQVTFEYNRNSVFAKTVKQYQLEDNVEYLGSLSYSTLFEHYRKATVVLFPSYLESFGLPLAEAAALGKPIICSDLPYARDVLNHYQNVTYIQYDNAHAWCQELHTLITHKNTKNNNQSNIPHQYSTSWKDFFDLI